MEPPSPGTASSAPPPSAPTRPPTAPAHRSPKPYLVVRAGADSRLIVGALAGGVLFDLAWRSGLATVAATAFVAAAAAVLLGSGRVRGRAGGLLVGAAPVLAVLFTLRSSPWVTVPTVFAVALLLVLGAAVGADGGGPSATFPSLGARLAVAVGHLGLAPGMLRSRDAPGRDTAARQRAAAAARGALLGLPVVIIVGLLLALADPIFRSWFDLRAIRLHLVLVLLGAWAVMGLGRAASAVQPTPTLRSAPSLGTVEAGVVLGGLCALYAAFVGAQFVALSGAGHRILVTQGLTYAQYARSGFFQLLGCAAITLVVLLGVRACASQPHPMLAGMSWLTAALTICVVVVAIRRLQLYEAAFGLTMLRLACMVAAVWIGVVFLLLGCTIPRRGLPRRCFPAAVLVSGLVLVGAWGAANPASIVALTNLLRAEHGRHLDVSQAVSLGPDAVPALLAGLGHLHGAGAAQLRAALCARPAGKDAGAAFNLSRLSANHALAKACGHSA
jgi:hypothetical protein